MADKIKFIKLLDWKTAERLAVDGFHYTKEKINNNQDVYVFEKSDDLIEKIEELRASAYESNVIIEDTTLNF